MEDARLELERAVGDTNAVVGAEKDNNHASVEFRVLRRQRRRNDIYAADKPKLRYTPVRHKETHGEGRIVDKHRSRKLLDVMVWYLQRLSENHVYNTGNLRPRVQVKEHAISKWIYGDEVHNIN